jgi:hypothetical protein
MCVHMCRCMIERNVFISVSVCVHFYYKLHYKGCIYKCVYYLDECAN